MRFFIADVFASSFFCFAVSLGAGAAGAFVAAVAFVDADAFVAAVAFVDADAFVAADAFVDVDAFVAAGVLVAALPVDTFDAVFPFAFPELADADLVAGRSPVPLRTLRCRPHSPCCCACPYGRYRHKPENLLIQWHPPR